MTRLFKGVPLRMAEQGPFSHLPGTLFADLNPVVRASGSEMIHDLAWELRRCKL